VRYCQPKGTETDRLNLNYSRHRSTRRYRRIVPSPIPIEIIEREAIKNSVDNGFLTIAVGGIPIIENERCGLKG